MEPLHGYHVTCDGRAADADWKTETVKAWLAEVIGLSQMNVIAGPDVYECQGTLIGSAIIAESHITVHAKPETGQLFAEMFSCKQFDLAGFIQATVRYFGITDGGTAHWFERGER